MAKRRGRPPRNGERATERIHLRLTLDEMRAIQRLAALNQCSLTDVLRLGALSFADDAGEPAPIMLGKDLIARISGAHNSAPARQLDRIDRPDRAGSEERMKLNALIQADIDNQAAIAKAKKEARGLPVAAADRTAAQAARLAALFAELDALEDSSISRSPADLVIARRLQEEARAQATPGPGDNGAAALATSPARGRRYQDLFPRVALDLGGFRFE